MNKYKVDILAFAAHPDDVECAAAGVVINQTQTGGTVAIVDLTKGELGSYGNVELRFKETQKATKIMGVKYRTQLSLKDGNIVNDEASRLLIIEQIRKFQPTIILCNAIRDRHPDHANAGKLVADAAFLSGLRMIKTSIGKKQQKEWRPKAVYHYIQDYFIQPDLVVDITHVFEKKMEAIKAYSSQFVEPKNGNANGISSLISQIESMNKIFGRPINSAFGEGYNVTRYLGIKNIMDII